MVTDGERFYIGVGPLSALVLSGPISAPIFVWTPEGLSINWQAGAEMHDSATGGTQ